MKNTDIKFNASDISAQLSSVGRKLGVYRAFLFFLAVAALYSFIVWRINVFSNAPASTTVKTPGVASQPHIDPETIAKIQSLQDNSVSVQTLFDSARQNPFQE